MSTHIEVTALNIAKHYVQESPNLGEVAEAHTDEFLQELDEAIERTQKLIDDNLALLAERNGGQAPLLTERVFSPTQFAFLDAWDSESCSPSSYYTEHEDFVEYIVEYLRLQPNDLGALLLAPCYGITVERNRIVLTELTRQLLEAIVEQDETKESII